MHLTQFFEIYDNLGYTDSEKAIALGAWTEAIKLLTGSQEPYGWIYDECIEDSDHAIGYFYREAISHSEVKNGIPIYTTPLTRKWVGLSDEKISELWYKSQNDVEGVNLGFTTQEHFFAGLIDTNLREKNNA